MNKKNLLHNFFSSLLIITLLGGNILSVKAQTSVAEDDMVSFQMMGEQDTILTGPLDSKEIVFRLPADWAVPTDGSILHLNLNAATGITSNAGVAGFVGVSLNQIWLTTINLNGDGEYSVDIPIPSGTWKTPPQNVSQILTLTLVDAIDCQMWLSISSTSDNVRGLSTVIRASSYIEFEHAIVPVPTDLKLFPYPIFQNTFIPEKSVLVISDQPTQGEIQAAMTISAAFGRLTDGRLDLSLVTISQLDDTIINESNIIFVGYPGAFPPLNEAGLPAPYNGTSFNNVQIGTDDGVLEMVTSPQNPSKVWLLVSGNNDSGIIKAAQAVGSDQIQPYGPANIAVISEVGTDAQETNQSDFTFSDLGYPFEQTYTGSYNDLGIWFDMPANRLASDGAFFEMVFSNSASLDFDASNVKVIINNNLIGGLRFSDRTTSITHWKFNIPTNILHPGRNLLLLELFMTSVSPCIEQDELWFSIAPDSQLHLPSSEMSALTRNLDLVNYPNSTFSTFEQTAMVLPASDPFTWSVASKLAFDLGRSLGGSNINIASYYADAIPDEILRSRDLILVGRPSTMPLINRFSQVMPAPFENGQDIAQPKNPQYSFIVTNNTPVGYIQVFSSPFDPKLSVLTISGNTTQGLNFAANSLLTQSLHGRMSGNFIVVMDNKMIVQQILVATSDTSQEIVLPGNQSSEGNGQPGSTGNFNISLPFVVLIVAIILVGIGVVVLFVWDKEDRPGKKVDNSKDNSDGN